MKNYKKLIIFSILLVVCIAIIAYLTDGYQENENTSMLFFNGNIITVDSTTSKPEAVFIKGSRIYFTGTLQDALKLTDANTIIINLKGRTLIPGFNDNHTHTLAAGSFYSEAILWNKTCEEIAVIISQEAKTKKPGELISGNSWDYTTCPKPHKSLLDKAAPNNPVFLTQYSGHAAWVNSRMLEEMGIDKNTPDPKGGQIVRDDKGEPTGILRDTAMGTSEYGKFIKQILSPSLHKKLITKALTLYKEAGITSVQDNTWEPFTVRLLKKYRNSQELSTRFTCWPMGNSPLYYAFTWFASFDKNDYWVRKIFYQPLLGIYYAVTRKSKDGTMGPLNKDECFSPYEALYCYTMGSAYAEFMENEKGSITKGKLADFVVLSDNLLTVPVHTIKDIKVLMTITGGRIVYKHNDF